MEGTCDHSMWVPARTQRAAALIGKERPPQSGRVRHSSALSEHCCTCEIAEAPRSARRCPGACGSSARTRGCSTRPRRRRHPPSPRPLVGRLDRARGNHDAGAATGVGRGPDVPLELRTGARAEGDALGADLVVVGRVTLRVRAGTDEKASRSRTRGRVDLPFRRPGGPAPAHRAARSPHRRV